MPRLIQQATLRATLLLAMLSQAGTGHSAETHLGITARRLAPAVRASLQLPRDAGLSIETIVTNSPAERAELQANDIITRLDDQWLFSREQLVGLVHSQSPGDQVTLSVIRQGQPRTIEVKLEAGSTPPSELDGPRVVTVPFDQWDDPAELVIALQEFSSSREQASPAGADSLVPADSDLSETESVTSWTQLTEVIEEEAELVVVLKRASPNTPESASVSEPSVVLVAPPGPSDDPAGAYSVAGPKLVVSIDEVGGSREATITTPGGALIFRGPIDTESDRERVPRWLRQRVTELLDSPTWTPEPIKLQDPIEVRILELQQEVI